jgi:hypothetical protein
MARRRIVYSWMAAFLCGWQVANPHGHGGAFVAEHKPGETPAVSSAPYQAVYALYRWDPPPEEPPPHTWLPEQQVTEMFVRGLARRDPVGFEKGKDNELVAVAGTEKIPLVEGRYCWHITAGSEYHGTQRLLHEAGENLLTVVELPFELAGVALVAPLLVVVGGAAIVGIGLGALCS